MTEKNRWRVVIDICKKSGLINRRLALQIFVYYAIAALATSAEGSSLVLLVDLFTGRAATDNPSWVLRQFNVLLQNLNIASTFLSMYIFVIFLTCLKAVLNFIVVAYDGYFGAITRRKIQETCFKTVLQGDWEFLRNMMVGQGVGTITEEATNISRFLLSGIRFVYGCITVLTYAFLALIISPQATLVLGLVAVPCLLALKYIFNIQAKIVEKLVNSRQLFYADITERLNGLFYIQVEKQVAYHILKGLRQEENLTKREIQYGFSQAFVMAFNLMLPAVMLIVFQIWTLYTGQVLSEVMYILAGIGVIGTRALSQVNIVVSSYGNLMGFSGSLGPVYNQLHVPEARKKDMIPETVVGVSARHISYFYDEKNGVNDMNLEVAVGNPLYIIGPSGCGKTTLANLIAGLYLPISGALIYVGMSQKEYSSSEFCAKIGYVTQDIQLFQGTIRENVNPYNVTLDDAYVWQCLERADASAFVQSMGGLDAEIAEAGRSLSGGQRRRLGIARTLVNNPDILILDEVTVGLDPEKKAELMITINEIARTTVTVIITHEAIDGENAKIYSFYDNSFMIR